MRNAIMEKINRLPSSAIFTRRSQGDVLSRVTNDVDTLSQSLEPEYHSADHICMLPLSAC